jgi:NH3-dependent NAD+ synthetase
MWLSGTTLVIMGITMSMVGYSINSQFAMAEKVLAKAETTQIAVAVEQAKGVEFKIGLKSQLDNIQTWMTTQSRRQEDMNNMLQRLMNDNEHSRQMPAEVKARN